MYIKATDQHRIMVETTVGHGLCSSGLGCLLYIKATGGNCFITWLKELCLKLGSCWGSLQGLGVQLTLLTHAVHNDTG